VSIAYRTMGDGPIDVIFLPGLFSHVEALLEDPGTERFFDRLSRVARIVLYDRRGSGLSDRPTVAPTIEEDVEDIEAVLDAVGIERAVLLGYTIGGTTAINFAHHRPERSLALILYASIVRNLRDEEIDWTNTPEERAARLAELVAEWGTGANLYRVAPSVADDPRMREWMGRLERQAMTPSGVGLIAGSFAHLDVRALLPEIRVPTLILHRRDDTLVDVRHSRYAAERIPGARFVELEGRDSLPQVGDSESLMGEIESFLGGSRQGSLDRELLTVLFTDIVGSTGHAARLGDAGFRDLLTQHERVAREELVRFGGEEVKTIGDSFLATFSGPPSQAVRCAKSLVAAMPSIGIEIRCGMHTGECERMGSDVGGMAVHIAARVSALAKANEVLVSGTTFGTVVGSGIEWEFRGDHALKGVPGEWPLFCVC
jgi:class 3 adenylate cyclase